MLAALSAIGKNDGLMDTQLNTESSLRIEFLLPASQESERQTKCEERNKNLQVGQVEAVCGQQQLLGQRLQLRRLSSVQRTGTVNNP
jgi:hypothetical protein